MFSLAVLKENVRLPPSKLRHDYIQAIVLALNQKYCNRVIINVGLCVSVFDVMEAGDPYVHPGEASAYVKVKFRLIVFRPFIGEVIEGKVRSNSEEGIHVSLGFFDDILIPPTCVQPDTTFDPAEQVWTWSYQGTKMFLDTGELIRVRVLQEHFEERAPVPKETLMAAVRAASTMAASEPAPLVVEDTAAGQQTAPYRLTASIAEDGLGLVRWWQPTSAIDGSEEDEERELDGEK